jgi:hypothetical protein
MWMSSMDTAVDDGDTDTAAGVFVQKQCFGELRLISSLWMTSSSTPAPRMPSPRHS